MSVAQLVGVVMLVVIGLLLLPIIQGAVHDAKEDANTTSTQRTLLDMVVLFYVLGLVLSAIFWVIRETGISGGGGG